MAIMIPDFCHGATVGEDQLFDLFKEGFSEDAYVWYERSIANWFPDFILLDPKLGIVIFEVKDWSLGYIQKISYDQMLTSFGKKVASPFAQIDGYKSRLQDQIKEICKQHKEARLFPGLENVNYIRKVIVFPNLNQSEIESSQNGLQLVKDWQGCSLIVKDDLEGISPSGFGHLVYDRLKNSLKRSFTHKEVGFLKDTIDPSCILQDPLCPIIKTFDQKQKQIAKRDSKTNVLIRGNAGSGKSLILYKRVRILLEREPDAKVLLVCFNNALKASLIHNEFQDLLANEKCNLTIINIDRLDMGNWEKAFDYILVDEGQDFEYEKYQELMQCKKIDGRVWIAADGAQNIYERSNYHYQSFGIVFDQTDELRINYRNTAQITAFSEAFLHDDELFPILRSEDVFDLDYITDLDAYYRVGPPPEIAEKSDWPSEMDYILNKIELLHLEMGVPYRDICVVAFRKQQCSELESHLKTVHIPVFNVAENKESVDLSMDKVFVSTIHSVKGLEFKYVFLVGFDQMLDMEKEKKMIYVALTRATQALYVTHSITNDFTDALHRAYLKTLDMDNFEFAVDSYRMLWMQDYTELQQKQQALEQLEASLKEKAEALDAHTGHQASQMKESMAKELIALKEQLAQAQAEKDRLRQELHQQNVVHQKLYQADVHRSEPKKRRGFLKYALIACLVLWLGFAGYKASYGFVSALLRERAPLEASAAVMDEERQELCTVDVVGYEVTGGKVTRSYVLFQNMKLQGDAWESEEIFKGFLKVGSRIQVFKEKDQLFCRITGDYQVSDGSEVEAIDRTFELEDDLSIGAANEALMIQMTDVPVGLHEIGIRKKIDQTMYNYLENVVQTMK